jgi:hypothetical protein
MRNREEKEADTRRGILRSDQVYGCLNYVQTKEVYSEIIFVVLRSKLCVI